MEQNKENKIIDIVFDHKEPSNALITYLDLETDETRKVVEFLEKELEKAKEVLIVQVAEDVKFED